MTADKGMGIFYLIVTIFLWSTIEVVSKPLNDEMAPELIAFLRFFIGGLILAPILLLSLKKVEWKTVRPLDWILLALLSLVGITATFLLFHIALQGITASAAATLISTVPLFVAPLSFFLLKERITWVGLTGILLGAAWILVIVLAENVRVASVTSPLMILVSVICFSVYSVGMKPLNQKMNPRNSTSLSLTLGAVLMVPFLAVEGIPLDVGGISTWSIVLILYLSFIAVGLAYLLYFLGLERISVSKGASFFYLKPLIATILAFIFLGESPSITSITAIVLISVSVYLVVAEAGVKKFISSISHRKEK